MKKILLLPLLLTLLLAVILIGCTNNEKTKLMSSDISNNEDYLQFFEKSLHDIENTFDEPIDKDVDSYGACYEYENVTFLFEKSNENEDFYVDTICFKEGQEIFGVKVGMTIEEISQVLGDPVDKGCLERYDPGPLDVNYFYQYQNDKYSFSFFSIKENSETKSLSISIPKPIKPDSKEKAVKEILPYTVTEKHKTITDIFSKDTYTGKITYSNSIISTELDEVVLIYDGDVYDGKLKEEVPNGKGKLYDRHGNLVFEGEFKDGQLWNGTYQRNAYMMDGTISDRIISIATISNGQLNFLTLYTFNPSNAPKNIYRYKGYLNGYANEFDKIGKLIYAGNHEDGKRYGRGIYETRHENTLYRIDAEWKNGKIVKLIKKEYSSLSGKEYREFNWDVPFISDLIEKPKDEALMADAFSRADWGSIKTMILNGANVNIINSSGGSMLGSAIFGGKDDIAKLMLEHGADPDSIDAGGDPVLIEAFFMKEYDLMKLIISKGADINKKDSKGHTALNYAIKSNNEDLVITLVLRGADINAKDYYLAKLCHNEKIAPLLLARNPKVVNEKMTPPGYISKVKWPLIHVFEDIGKNEIVISLIEEGADVNAQDSEGNTLLHKYVSHSDENMIRLLLDKGADKNIKNNKGQKAGEI